MSLASRLEAIEAQLDTTKKSFRLTDTYAEAVQIELDNPDDVIFQMVLNDPQGKVEYKKHNPPHLSKKIYVACHTARQFHLQEPDKDPKVPYIRGIFGPIGSGKSVALMWECLYITYCQKAQPDGVKRSKIAIIRNTKPMLRDTSIYTFQQWFGKDNYNDTKLEQFVNLDGMEMHILFRGLDKPRDIGNVLSLELSAAFLNECKEIPHFVWENIDGRTGRYPSREEGGTTRAGIIFDSNYPSNVHWLHDIFEDQKPIGHKLYKQPSGLSKLAENKENLEEGYYEKKSVGKTKRWVRVYVEAKYGFSMSGKPVHPDFESSVHMVPCKWLGYELVMGIDWGRTPCCAILQEVNGQWQMIHEITTDNMGAKQFGVIVAEQVKRLFPGATITGWGDPSGEPGTQADDNSPFMMFRLSGLNAAPAPGQNNIVMRREALDTLLMTLAPNHQPRFIVDPSCKKFIAGMAGAGYCKRVVALNTRSSRTKAIHTATL